MASDGNACDHAFAKRAVATGIRDMCETARSMSLTAAEVIAMFEGLADMVENPHPFGEFVPKEPHVRDETPHGPLWDTGESEPATAPGAAALPCPTCDDEGSAWSGDDLIPCPDCTTSETE